MGKGRGSHGRASSWRSKFCLSLWEGTHFSGIWGGKNDRNSRYRSALTALSLALRPEIKSHRKLAVRFKSTLHSLGAFIHIIYSWNNIPKDHRARSRSDYLRLKCLYLMYMHRQNTRTVTHRDVSRRHRSALSCSGLVVAHLCFIVLQQSAPGSQQVRVRGGLGRLAVCRRIVCGGESEGKRKGEEARSREGRAW